MSAKRLVDSKQLSLEKLNAQLAQEGLQPIVKVSLRPVTVLTTDEAAAASGPGVTIIVIAVVVPVAMCDAA